MIAPALLQWFDEYGRKHLPWQENRTAYRVWVSEIMLQQTQVSTVHDYFLRFMSHFPSVENLAEAEEDAVLALWSGLGYYARARNLHRTAKIVMSEFNGEFPADLDALQSLPGIGRSTAGAILTCAFNQRAPILDGNVKRVLARLHTIEGWPGETRVAKALWAIAEEFTPHERVADYTQAIMDLGATVCIRQPLCEQCPLTANCQAYAEGRTQEFPGKKPKKKTPIRNKRFLLIQDDEENLLLMKRPPQGIWGGLWSLPECAMDENPVEWALKTLGIQIILLEDWPSFRHTFSHFHLDIQPQLFRRAAITGRVMEPAQHVWYNAETMAHPGVPAPVQQLLQQWETQPHVT